jgi:Xaa-Pro aminopeptidase
MQTPLTKDFFTRNRVSLQKLVGDSTPIIIAANGYMQQTCDEPIKFFQDSDFWYLTGIHGADLTLVIYKQSTYIIVPGLSDVREAFDGSHDIASYESQSGVSEYLTEREGWRRLKAELNQSKTAATLYSDPEHMESHGLFTLPFRRYLITRLKQVRPSLEIVDIRSKLADLRTIKQPEEMIAIRHVIDITCSTLNEMAKDALNTSDSEYGIEAAISYGFRSRGATGHAFAPVIGAGRHTTTLHYLENNDPIKKDDLIVVDIGAQYEHYSSDIARTISKTPITGRKAEVFNAVAAAQDYAISLLKPGVQQSEYEKAVESFIGDQLLRLGVIKKTTSEIIRRYFPHRTSHFIGLDAHDVGDFRTPLTAGMVLACEPGIYLPDEQIGVRIEDDILITDDGCEILSKACPQALTPVQ